MNCTDCKEKLTKTNTVPSQLDHRMYRCKDCTNKIVIKRGWRIAYLRRLKKEIIEHYGGKCKCCGETNWEFLSIDHINGGGLKHRKELGGSGNKIYRYLRSHNYPKKEFQLLCMNCNTAKGHYGYCPHKKGAK